MVLFIRARREIRGFGDCRYRFGNRIYGERKKIDVLDEGPIHPDHVRVVGVFGKEDIILASDGYPRVFEPWAKSEVLERYI